MAKAYWITTYRAINDPKAVAEYAKLGGRRFRRRVDASWFEAHRQRHSRPDSPSARSSPSSTALRAPLPLTRALPTRPR